MTYSHGGAVVSCLVRYGRVADDTRSRPNTQPALPFMSGLSSWGVVRSSAACALRSACSSSGREGDGAYETWLCVSIFGVRNIPGPGRAGEKGQLILSGADSPR